MQLVRREDLVVTNDVAIAEQQALGRVKSFCSRILKILAPPLLQEVESATSLRASAEPFTPRRSSRFSTPIRPPSKQVKKASAAENALLKALGLSAENFSAGKDAIQELKEFFDSPVRDPQLHVLAAIFGKTMPAREELTSRGALEISVSA
jgi:hypothetical protein